MTDTKTLEQRLIPLIAQQLGFEEAGITLDKGLESDLGADSLDILEIAMAVEEEFDISIPDSQVDKIVTVKDVIDLVRSMTVPQNNAI